jgi:nucleotide-binding universal stress UspA family protein
VSGREEEPITRPGNAVGHSAIASYGRIVPSEITDRNGDRPVLFAYDGSNAARAAIREAARQLSPGRGAVVVTVWQPLADFSFGGVAYAAPEFEESIQAEAMDVAREGAKLACSVGFRAVPVPLSGSPVWHTIVTAADELDASLVAMGSHGRTGLGLVLLGSIAAAVSRHTDCPVLIVHATPADS